MLKVVTAGAVLFYAMSKYSRTAGWAKEALTALMLLLYVDRETGSNVATFAQQLLKSVLA